MLALLLYFKSELNPLAFFDVFARYIQIPLFYRDVNFTVKSARLWVTILK